MFRVGLRAMTEIRNTLPRRAVQHCRVSIVIPVRDEAASIERVVAEVDDVMAGQGSYEIVFVDDGSVDQTAVLLEKLIGRHSWMRALRHETACGKSAALRTGIWAARGVVIVTLDGNGRSDPAVIPKLLTELAESGAGCGLVAGQRLGRRDSASQRLRSKVANTVRAALLDDGARDSGCGLKCFPRDVFLDLPFFDGQHRFLPALIRGDGYSISLVDVVDRPRFTPGPRIGLFLGLWTGLVDTLGVAWLVRRRRVLPVVYKEMRADTAVGP